MREREKDKGQDSKEREGRQTLSNKNNEWELYGWPMIDQYFKSKFFFSLFSFSFLYFMF